MNWYATREQLKAAVGAQGSTQHARLDRILEGCSRRLDKELRRWFIPRTETRLYRWPQEFSGQSYRLWLDADLLAVTTLQTKAQDSSPATIAAADYFLEPANADRFNRVEIDLSSTAAFEGGNTAQRSISVAGRWGYSEDTETAGTVSSGLASDATATSFVCSDGSLIDVGDTLLIESEQLFVSERANAQVGTQLLNGALTADKSGVAVTVDDGSQFRAGEVLLVESERLYVESISGNVLTVQRAYDGSVLAAHADNTAVHAFRTLTVARRVNGTTAAVHANATAISKYVPPLDIVTLCLAEAVAMYHQETAGWGRTIGTGEGAITFRGVTLADLRQRVEQTYKRARNTVAI